MRTMANDPGSLGLRPPMTAGQLATDQERPYVEYTLPERHLGMEWAGSGFTDQDRTFRLIELTPA